MKLVSISLWGYKDIKKSFYEVRNYFVILILYEVNNQPLREISTGNDKLINGMKIT